MKKHLSKISVASFLVLVILLVTTFALPCAPAQAAESGPVCWGVFVGVGDYESLNDLPYSGHDAQELYEALSPVWGISHTTLLLDSQAKKADILAAVSWLASNAGANDTVLFTFSGYGSYSGVFHPYDSSGPSSVNSISPTELANAFQSVKAGKIIFILNCGAAGTFQTSLAGSGRVIIMSSGSTENTYSIGFLQHSVFIYYFLQAVANFDTVDTNHDYVLSAEEIFQYAAPLTTQYEQDNYFPSIQHPVIDDGYSGEFPLLAKFTFSADAILPSGTNILTLDGVSYTSAFPAIFWAPGVSHTLTVPQTVDAGSGTHYAFAGWNDGIPSNTRVVSQGSYTTDYNKEYFLSVNSTYGSPTGAGWYKDGSTANFSVTSFVQTSDSKHYFTGWTGGYTGNSATGSLAMSAPQTLTANWRNEYFLTLNSDYGSPTGTGWYTEGQSVNISVEPEQGFIVRHIFTDWSGDLASTESSSTVTMNSPKVITANWRTDYIQLYILIIIVLVLGGGAAAAFILIRRRNKKALKKV